MQICNNQIYSIISPLRKILPAIFTGKHHMKKSMLMENDKLRLYSNSEKKLSKAMNKTHTVF